MSVPVFTEGGFTIVKLHHSRGCWTYRTEANADRVRILLKGSGQAMNKNERARSRMRMLRKEFGPSITTGDPIPSRWGKSAQKA